MGTAATWLADLAEVMVMAAVLQIGMISAAALPATGRPRQTQGEGNRDSFGATAAPVCPHTGSGLSSADASLVLHEVALSTAFLMRFPCLVWTSMRNSWVGRSCIAAAAASP